MSLWERVRRWLCGLTEHDWRRELGADGEVRWWCARCAPRPNESRGVDR